MVDDRPKHPDRAKQANGSGEYATRLVSTPWRRDGLYWPVAEGEAESPLGPLIDAAQDAGCPGELAGGKPIPETARIVASMTIFDPDLTWSRVAMTNE